MKELDYLIKKYGFDNVFKEFLNIKNTEENTLTVVCNSGIHNLPKSVLLGDVYHCSEGNLDFVDANSIENAIIEILEKLKVKLHEKKWTKIYLIPTGHQALGLNIKLFILKVTGITPIDFFYLQGKYFPIKIDYRSI